MRLSGSTANVPAALLALLLLLLSACDTSAVESVQRVAEGLEFAAQNEHLEAVRRFEAGVALDPDNAAAHYFLGLVRLQHYHAPGEAIVNLGRAVELDGDHAEARYQLGVAYDELGQTEPALASFREAVALDGQHGRALYRMGVHAESDGEIRDAIDLYTRSIYASPTFPNAYNALGNIYLEYGRPQEAMQVFQNAIENESRGDASMEVGYAQNRADLGRVYLDLGEFDAAIAYLREATELDGAPSSTQFNLGIAYRQRFATNGSADDRTAALAHLSAARSRCNPSLEQARCSSIAAALADLQEEGAP